MQNPRNFCKLEAMKICLLETIVATANSAECGSCCVHETLGRSRSSILRPGSPVFSMVMKYLFSGGLALATSTLFATDIPALEAKAKSGDAKAQFELARIYLKGTDGVSKNVMRSFELMTFSAQQGNAAATGGLGYFYANGMVVAKDAGKALEWFRKAADKGDPVAQLNLGNMLAEGKGIQTNEAEGRKWIKAAADQGQPDASYAMGAIYYFGSYGQSVDFNEAYPYLLKAAEAGHPVAQNMVGVMLENGRGVQMDADQAEKWYRKSANQGNLKAQGNLGRLLGPEVEDRERRIEAITWLLIASKRGEITAQKMLEEMHSGLNPDDVAEAQNLADDLEKSLSAVNSR